MHDIKAIRDNPEASTRGLAKRGLQPQAGELLSLSMRKAATSSQKLQDRRRAAMPPRRKSAQAMKARRQGEGRCAQGRSRAHQGRHAAEEEARRMPTASSLHERARRHSQYAARRCAGRRRRDTAMSRSAVHGKPRVPQLRASSISRSANAWASWISRRRRNSPARALSC